MIVVVATYKERLKALELFPKAKNIIVTGVGGTNVYQALKKVNRNTKIVNFGYAGSNVLPIGEKVTISKSSLFHPNVDYKEPIFMLYGDYPCYSSNDFVLKTDIEEPCVFDMELAYICAMGFKNIESIKIISDNLSLKEYESKINEDS